MKIKRALGVIVIALAMTITLGACSSAAAQPDSAPQSASKPTYAGPVPAFSGPWAAEFAQAYRSTTSSVVHEILAKGAISDQDYATLSGMYVKCMANKGFTVQITGPAGQSSISSTTGSFNSDAALAAQKACDGDFATVSALRNDLLSNPQHLDQNQIVTACLVKKKLVPASYTEKDYARDLQTQQFPFDIKSPAFTSCTSDPLGLTAGK